MKFKYYITDTFDGCIKGTNSFELATQFAECSDYFVVDTESGEWLTPSGAVAVKEMACAA